MESPKVEKPEAADAAAGSEPGTASWSVQERLDWLVIQVAGPRRRFHHPQGGEHHLEPVNKKAGSAYDAPAFSDMVVRAPLCPLLQ